MKPVAIDALGCIGKDVGFWLAQLLQGRNNIQNTFFHQKTEVKIPEQRF